MFRYLIPLLLIFVSNTVLAKKINCDYEMSQLKSVQARMKQGNYGEKTRDIERKLHTKYQICRKNKNSPSSSNSKAKHLKVNDQKKSYNKSKAQPPIYPKQLGSPALLNIKGRYEGRKQNGWIQYYKTPKDCFRPKSTATFAKCLNNRDEEAKKFDIIWNKNNQKAGFKLG